MKRESLIALTVDRLGEVKADIANATRAADVVSKIAIAGGLVKREAA